MKAGLVFSTGALQLSVKLYAQQGRRVEVTQPLLGFSCPVLQLDAACLTLACRGLCKKLQATGLLSYGVSCKTCKKRLQALCQP